MKNISDKAKKAEKVWGEAYNVLWKVINKKNYKVGAEIGVAYGGHSERILQKTKAKLYCIDPYKKISKYDDPMNMSQKKFDKLYEFTKKRLSIFGNRAKLIRKTSRDATNSIKGEIDFVYIDADHSYVGVKKDISNWFFKVRDGGIIAGHDYGHDNFPGVKKAIDEFFSRFSWKIHTHKSGVWWVKKKPICISFIIPAFNSEDTIEESVRSIYAGNFFEGDEIVVVDDGSSDKTFSIVKKMKKKHRDIKIIKHKFNKGGGAARNTAVENTKNELIFCLDSDNILNRNSINKLKKYLINNTADVVAFEEVRYFDKNKNTPTHSWFFDKNKYEIDDYFTTCKVPGASGNYLFTKESWFQVGRYHENLKALDTWGFGFKQVANNLKVSVLPKSFYYHRVSENSYWNRELKNNLSLLAISVIIPFAEKIDKRIIAYILSKKGRNNWFNEIESKKIINKKHKKISLRLLVEKFKT